MNPEQWLSLKWNGGSTMSDRWLNQSKIIHEKGGTSMKWDKEVVLALIDLAETVVLVVKEISLAKIDKERL